VCCLLLLSRFTDNTYLALKLAGVLAWPCISVAAVLQPSVMAHNSFTANFTVAALQVRPLECWFDLPRCVHVCTVSFRPVTKLHRALPQQI
jgi:hypothetical protein